MNEYPEKKSINVKILVNLIVIAAVVFFVLKTFVGTNRTIHIVNELGAPAAVLFPGQEQITAARGQIAVLKAPKGQHQVEVQVGTGPTVKVPVDIDGDRTYILNVGSGAVIVYEETMYSQKLDPNLKLPYIIHAGEPFLALPKADYLFEEFPEKITLYGEEKSKKSRIGVIKSESFYMVPYLLSVNIRPEKILSYIEAHLPFNKKDGDLLSMYFQLCLGNNSLDRGLEFLSRGLAERPVLTDWHRNYQEIVKYKGEAGKLFAQYDAMREKEPGNSALLYLRGRIEPGVEKSLAYYDRAIAADSKNPFPYFAKAYMLAGRGEFARAVEFSTEAYKLNPESAQMKELHFQVSFAAGRFNELEKKAQVELAASPLNQQALQRLLALRFVKKDHTGLEIAFSNYIKMLKKKMPEDPFQLEIQSRMTMAYLREDFDTYADLATRIKDEGSRKEYLQMVYLNRGEMAKTEAIPGIEQTMDRFECLLYWLGWQDLGQPEKAARWLKAAQEKFRRSKEDDRVAAEWFDRPCPDIVERLLNLPAHYETKRMLYPVFARMCPKERGKLLAMAEKLNFSIKFPYHFLNKMIRGMK